MDVEVALDAHAIIGESPTWSAVEHALYWVDIKKPAFYRYDPRLGSCQSWMLSSDVGAFALIDSKSAVVALRYGIHRLDFTTGALELLAPPPFDPTLFRFNEGLCDHAGRFWVGVMFDPLHDTLPHQRAPLHSFTLAEGLRREQDEAELHNGMALSEDRKRFYLAHSYEGSIYVFEFDGKIGLLGPGELFAHIPKSLGLPDGAAVDAESCYWCAVHGGSRLRRYTPEGRIEREVMLPVSQPTMCAFGDDDLATLYVTSASDGLNAAQRSAEPFAGALFRLRPGVKGIARPYKVS
ncbi:MAG: SMP-30/gluconolactonase/LRE family protein [Xanthobacteraceae bacterium]